MFDVARQDGAEKRCLALQRLHVQNFKAIFIPFEVVHEELEYFVMTVVAFIVKNSPKVALFADLFSHRITLFI